MIPAASIPALLGGARGLRGVAQGYLAVAFLPALHTLGWSSLTLGGALSGGLLADFLLTLVVGAFADRLPPRRLLMAGELAGGLATLPFFLHPSPLTLVLALFLAGAGQRSNGSPGPWGPSEQILLARLPPSTAPFLHFGHTMALGLAGMGAGALLARGVIVAPERALHMGMAGLLASSLACLFLVSRLPPEPPPSPAPAGPTPQENEETPSSERRKLLLLVATNVTGGLAMGLVDPVIAYWFLVRFHPGTASIALALATAFGASAAVSLLLGRIRSTATLPLAVLALMGISVAAGLTLPFAATVGAAGLLYAIRLSGMKAPGGIRQALALTLVHPRRKGRAAALHLSSLQAAQIAGPLLAGLLFGAGQTTAPLVAAGALAGISLGLFFLLYRSGRQKERPTRLLESEKGGRTGQGSEAISPSVRGKLRIKGWGGRQGG